jgi:hypothetical protein
MEIPTPDKGKLNANIIFQENQRSDDAEGDAGVRSQTRNVRS